MKAARELDPGITCYVKCKDHVTVQRRKSGGVVHANMTLTWETAVHFQ